MTTSEIIGYAIELKRVLEQKLLSYLTVSFLEIFQKYPTLQTIVWEQDVFNGASPTAHHLLKELEINNCPTPLSLKEFSLKNNDPHILQAAQEIAEIIFKACPQEVLDVFGNRLEIRATKDIVSLHKVSLGV